MKKMQIVVCDTNKNELEANAKLIRSICENHNVIPELVTFTSSANLLFEMDDPIFASKTHLLIVDPEDGFSEALSAVRGLGFEGIILCLSHVITPEYLFRAFEAKAFNYIQKGEQNAVRFLTVFKEALNKAEHMTRQSIVVKHKGEYRKIDIQDIEFCETTASHMVSVYYNGRSFEFISTLSMLEEQLENHGFIRVHRSYLVAKKYIDRVSFNMLTMRNGSEIPIGRRYYAQMKKEKQSFFNPTEDMVQEPVKHNFRLLPINEMANQTAARA